MFGVLSQEDHMRVWMVEWKKFSRLAVAGNDLPTLEIRCLPWCLQQLPLPCWRYTTLQQC